MCSANHGELGRRQCLDRPFRGRCCPLHKHVLYFLQDPDALKSQPEACRCREHVVAWALHEQLLCPMGSGVAGHASIAYFWILILLYALSPKYAYLFSEMLEAHAVDTYYGAQTYRLNPLWSRVERAHPLRHHRIPVFWT